MDLAPKSTESNPAVNREQPGLPFEAAQGETSSTNELNVSEAANPETAAPKRVLWLHRISLVIFVVFCIELGVLLAILPWTPMWNQNSFLAAYPGLRSFAQHNFVRGIATGVGWVDIWIGIWEAVHYRDPGKR
jgi:hypothetical protein